MSQGILVGIFSVGRLGVTHLAGTKRARKSTGFQWFYEEQGSGKQSEAPVQTAKLIWIFRGPLLGAPLL